MRGATFVAAAQGVRSRRDRWKQVVNAFVRFLYFKFPLYLQIVPPFKNFIYEWGLSGRGWASIYTEKGGRDPVIISIFVIPGRQGD